MLTRKSMRPLDFPTDHWETGRTPRSDASTAEPAPRACGPWLPRQVWEFTRALAELVEAGEVTESVKALAVTLP